MMVHVVSALLLVAAGIFIAEGYHTKQRALLRVLQGRPPFKPFPKPAPQSRTILLRQAKQPQRRQVALPRCAAPGYPTPAVKPAHPIPDNVIPIEAWVKLAKERKVTARRQAGEWRVG